MQNKKTKTFYPKSFRYRAFLKMTQGKNLYDILLDEGYIPNSKDKKYIAKLSYKWKKEFFDADKIFSNPTNEVLKEEIILMGDVQNIGLYDFI